MQDSAALLSSPFSKGDRSGGFDVERLLAPEQAIIAFFARARIAPAGIERVPLSDAAGRVLAEDANARENVPSHARSTMDGYAVASADGSASRRVVADIAMGAPPPRALSAREAMRIPTGGALPSGADAVVPQEDVQHERDAVVPRERVVAGDAVTQRAEDIRAGDVVLAAGRRIGAPELGVLATLGSTTVPVYRRPRVGIVSTGDELVAIDRAPGPGQVRDSNRYALAGSLAAMGAEPVQLPHAADIAGALHAIAGDGLAACDGLVLSGGSSVGERDFVPRVVSELGPPGILVHGLRVKPGKPTVLAAVGCKPVIGLPGNPTSALLILEAVVRPIVLALTGAKATTLTPMSARARTPFVGRAGWTWYVPVRVLLAGGALVAEPLVIRSAYTSLLTRAAGYAIIGESDARVDAGESVLVYPFSSGGAPVEVV